MASIYKPTFLRPVPAGAVRLSRKDGPAVKYTDGKGKAHVRPVHRDRSGNETGLMVCEQSCWWLKWTLPDGTVRRGKGFRDQIASEQEAAKREREAMQAGAGVLLVDPAHLSAPITKHIGDYVADLELRGRTRKHCEVVENRLTSIVNGADWLTIGQIGPDALSKYLSTLKADGLAAKTLNEYIGVGKAFCGWLVASKRLAGNPLASVARVAKAPKTFVRRALTRDECKRLLAAAGSRRLVYLTAMRTGLRRNELRHSNGRTCISKRASACRTWPCGRKQPRRGGPTCCPCTRTSRPSLPPPSLPMPCPLTEYSQCRRSPPSGATWRRRALPM